MTARTPDPLLTIEEVAARLGDVPVKTVRHWRHQGTGPRMFRVGRELRCDPKDLEAWIRARKAETGDLSKALIPHGRPRRRGKTTHRVGEDADIPQALIDEERP